MAISQTPSQTPENNLTLPPSTPKPQPIFKVEGEEDNKKNNPPTPVLENTAEIPVTAAADQTTTILPKNETQQPPIAARALSMQLPPSTEESTSTMIAALENPNASDMKPPVAPIMPLPKNTTIMANPSKPAISFDLTLGLIIGGVALAALAVAFVTLLPQISAFALFAFLATPLAHAIALAVSAVVAVAGLGLAAFEATKMAGILSNDSSENKTQESGYGSLMSFLKSAVTPKNAVVLASSQSPNEATKAPSTPTSSTP